MEIRCLTSQHLFMQLKALDPIYSLTSSMGTSTMARILVDSPSTMRVRLMLQLKYSDFSRRGISSIYLVRCLCLKNFASNFCIWITLRRHPSEFRGGRIGIITPYKSQLSLLHSRFSSAFGPSVTAEIEFNTVDGFQGREVDILLLSTVRAAETCSAATKINSSNIGFVADVRRMNVSLTRARHSLWVLGNVRTLQTNHNWAALVRNAKERNLVVTVKKPYESLFKSAFKKLPALENSSNCSKELKQDGKIKEPGSHAGPNQKAGDENDERKKRDIGSGACSDLRRAGAEDNPLLFKGSIKTNKRARNEHAVAVNKDPLPVAVASSDGRASKCMQSAIPGKGGTAERSRGRGSGERQLHTQSPNLTEGKGKFENRTSNTDQSDDGKSVDYELLKPIVSKGLAKSDKHSRKQRKMEAVVSSSVRTVQRGDGNDESKASNQANTPDDAIAKRKQQRDAVDALLSSALISSKKAETSLRSLPVKRPVSPKSRVGGGIKPPKPRKGTILCSISTSLNVFLLWLRLTQCSCAACLFSF